MSMPIGLAAMHLQPAERIAHTEYCSNHALVRAVTGLDPRTDGRAWRAFYDAWEYDLLWVTNDGPQGFGARGRTTDMGHAEFLEDRLDWRDTVYCPFKTVEEVWAFDAVEEYGLEPMDELIAYYEGLYRREQAAYPHQIYTGGYYNTLISGAIQAFGWEMLLLAAADRERMERVLDSIFEVTLHHVKAWARTSIKVFIQHDDIVWSAGPFIHPDFYRRVLFTRYRKLWQILHEAGKIVLFCSDGTFTEFVDDIFDAGADGLIFEPTTSLDYVAQKYGATKVIVGSKVDCRTLTFGKPADIRHEIDETLAIARQCPGFVFAVGNHIPSNVPVENALFYFDYLRAHWAR